MRKIVVFVGLLAYSVAGFAADLDLQKTAKLCGTKPPDRIQDSRVALAIQSAREQHKLFGSQVIDGKGGVVSVGYHEAEFDHGLSDPTPTWKRVADFWAQLDETAPSTFTLADPPKKSISRKRLYEQIVGLNSASKEPAEKKLDGEELDAISTSFLRNSLVDHPWSAAFISYVMKNAGFKTSEFRFSESHVDYVDRAFVSTTTELAGSTDQYAYRACDIKTTVPKAGDLICYTRQGAARLTTFQALSATLALSRAELKTGSVPMHCDLVVLADDKGNSKLESIGGNVFQSVTLRKMSLNEDKRISTIYIASENPKTCVDVENCPGNLNYKPWAVLLQLRPPAIKD